MIDEPLVNRLNKKAPFHRFPQQISYLSAMLDKAPLELNSDFQYALDLLEKSNTSAFITGRAGTGKSTLLQLFKNTTHKKVVVLAPTGVAALNVQGQTVHSFFRFPGKPITKRDIKKLRNRKLYLNMEVLVIDEISMVRADMLDNIDYFLQLNRENPAPFGGLQVIFFGDLFQLPPVVSSDVEQALFKDYYNSPYFFSAKLFKQGFEIEMIELRKTYRQESRHFLRLLDAVRLNQFDMDDLEDLNERHLPLFEIEDYYITLSTRNRIVDQINDRRLARLLIDEYSYSAIITGKFDPRFYPADPILRLKVGAQVMFVKNDPQRRFVNGSIGKVVQLGDHLIKVMIEKSDGSQRTIEVERLGWEIERYKASEETANAIDTEVLGSFTQYPLRLAWAITIHKSQGKTFDKVIIDLGKGAFEHGQTYVALSRCRTLEGVVLKQEIRPRDVMVDERVVDYYEANF